MSAEYPTLNISVPLDQIRKIVHQITLDFAGELVEENNAFKLKVKYDQILDDEQLNSKLTLGASARYKSKGFMLVWLAGFLTILSILALVSAKFRVSDSDKNEAYYNSLSAKIAQVELLKSQDKEVVNFKKLQESGLKEVARNRVVAQRTLAVSGGFISVAIILLLLAYLSKVRRKKRILEIKEELLHDSSREGKNPNLESREDTCGFRLFDTENSTEFIFEDEEGSVLLVYLVGLVVEGTHSYESSAICKGNEPLEEMINRYRHQEIPSIKLDKNILERIDFD